MAENINRRLNIYINDREVVNSMRGITSEITRTRNELRNLNRGAADYDQELDRLTRSLSELTSRQATFRSEISGSISTLQKMKNAIGPVASGLLTAFSVGAVVSGFTTALLGASKKVLDFEQKIADLKSITGATGKDLEFLENRAIELGKQTKGGAEMVVEAYKLIASAKPELLENVKDLDAVTQAVLTLSQASGMELPDAAKKLTDAMNQFNAPASDAALFVDALANGAKYGAAEIPEITDALLKFGAVANNTNISIQESTALIELLAEKGLKGAEAGTALRNVLLKLSAPDALPKEARQEFEKLGISMEFLKDKTIPIQQKMEALKPLLKDNASIVKVFGTENATAAINIISHTDRLKELSSKMNEFGTAQEQADIKTNTLQGDLDKLSARYDSLVLSINKGSSAVANFARSTIKSLSNVLDFTALLFKDENQLTNYFKDLGKQKGLKEYQAVMQNISSASKEQQEATKKELLSRERENIRVNQAIVQAEKEKRASILGGDRALLHLQTKMEEDALVQIGKSAEKMKLIKESAIKSTKKTVVTNTSGGTTPNTEDSETAKKAREKALADAKKHAEDLLKIEEDLQKQLLATRRAAEDLKLGLIKDDLEREKAILNSEYDRKIEDLKANLQKEQDAIAVLQKGIGSNKTSSGDLASFKIQLQERLAIQSAYNETLVATNQTRDLKIAALQEKYLKVDFDKKQEANARDLQNLHTKHDNELASITDLASAKAILASSLTPDELNKVRDLETAKKKIKEQFQKEEIALQIKHLTDLSAVMKGMLENTTLPPEQREAILKFYDDLAAKLAPLKLQLAGLSNPPDKKNADLSGVDILGFSAEQWAETFSHLDSFEGKLAAVKLAVGAVQNAFGMYFQFLEAGEKRSLQKAEVSNRKKTTELNNQLEKGYISQEIYNSRKAKLDQELAKKQAEIEYKQAKRQKAMAAAQVIANTAMAIMSIWSTGGGTRFADFGISAGVLTGIAAALGAAQLGLVLAQPLPSKEGFYDGGYTGSGPERNSPGPVHYDEYVVPKKVLFSNDPVVPNIMGYLEAKRQGKSPQILQEQSTVPDSAQSGSGSSETNQQVINSLNRNSAILEKIEENGMVAFLENNIKTAKKMRDKIKELTTLESKSKL